MVFRVVFAFALFIIYIGCSGKDNPVSTDIPDSDPLPDWCYAIVDSALAGVWYERRTDHHDRLLEYIIDIKRTDYCAYTYTYLTYLYVEEDTTLVYRSEGNIIVSEVQDAGSVINMKIESKRNYYFQVSHDLENVTESFGTSILETSFGKIWGDYIILWGRQLKRRE